VIFAEFSTFIEAKPAQYGVPDPDQVVSRQLRKFPSAAPNLEARHATKSQIQYQIRLHPTRQFVRLFGMIILRKTKAVRLDNSTLFFVQKALETAREFQSLFSEDDITNCFYILDDFRSAGRISGKQRIPISRLESGKKYIVDGQRLDVNPSVGRYKKEIQNLAAAL
jgi:hypothetical protein